MSDTKSKQDGINEIDKGDSKRIVRHTAEDRCTYRHRDAEENYILRSEEKMDIMKETQKIGRAWGDQ